MNLPTHGGHSPLVETFRNNKRLLMRLAGLAAFGAVGFYLMFLPVAAFGADRGCA